MTTDTLALRVAEAAQLEQDPEVRALLEKAAARLLVRRHRIVHLPLPRTWPAGQLPAPFIPCAWPHGDDGAPDGAVRCVPCGAGLEHLGRGLEHQERTGHSGLTFVGGSDRVWSVIS